MGQHDGYYVHLGVIHTHAWCEQVLRCLDIGWGNHAHGSKLVPVGVGPSGAVVQVSDDIIQSRLLGICTKRGHVSGFLREVTWAVRRPLTHIYVHSCSHVYTLYARYMLTYIHTQTGTSATFLAARTTIQRRPSTILIS
jgi:hypothetical protein